MERGTAQKNGSIGPVQSISLEDFGKTLDFLEASGVSIVSLVGGEPTLHPDFTSIVQLSLERGFTVSIKSNATWHEKIGERIQELPDDGIHFLLNINHPSALGARNWQRIVQNVNQLTGVNVDFQFNIDRIDFDYEYILELARDVKPGKIVWSLSNLVIGEGSVSLTDPIAIQELYSKRILAFIIEAGKLGVKTVGVHGITPCMFSDEDYAELLANGGNLESTCQPVFDILPDLSVLYCFPMSNFWEKKFIHDFQTIQELNLEFQGSLAFMRSDLYPRDKCSECDHFLTQTCYGGCIARHLDGYEIQANDQEFFDRVPLVAQRYQLERASSNGQSGDEYYLLDTRTEARYPMDPLLSALMIAVDGQRSFRDLYSDVFPKLENNTGVESIFQEIAEQLIKRGVLILKPHRNAHRSEDIMEAAV